MTVTTSYPGVYLSENASLNFSVTSIAATVPAFVFIGYGWDESPADGNIVGYDSLNEFLADGRITPPEITDNTTSYYRAVQLWFLNGGGRCYLVCGSKLNQIKQYSDINLLVSAGADNSGYEAVVYEGFNTLIEEGYPIFGLFDGPEGKISTGDNVDTIMRKYPLTSRAAVFYPYVQPDWTQGLIPGSAVAAVAIAKTDRTRGVWKAPANVVVDGVTPKYPVSDDLQGRFNQGKALNMIRTFPDTGTVVWGARTLEDSDNWRYIPVRRLFSMVERDIQRALNKLVFEPNSQPTWQRVKAAIDNYLYSLWQQGALLGNKAEEAWFVEIGKDITMTDEDIKQGKMIVKIGLAAVRPAEFILLQFSQDVSQ